MISTRSIVLLAAVLLCGCGEQPSGAGGTESETQAPVSPAEHADHPLVKPFKEEGPAALRVDGVPVPKATLERYKQIYKIRRPTVSDKTLMREVIEEGIVPLAAMYAHYAKTDIAELSRRAWAAHERLEAGEQWGVVLADVSDDPNKSIQFGSIGVRQRLSVPGLAPPSPEVEERAFSQAMNTHSEPFCTDKGVEIVLAKNEVRSAGRTEAQATREIYSILFLWDAGYRELLAQWGPGRSEAEAEEFKAKVARFKEGMKRRIRAARIEVLDEEYRSVIYPFRLAKKGDSDG